MNDNKPIYYCATIGNFDGVHQGHRMVLRRLKQLASERSMKTMVVTFDRHPAAVVRPDAVPAPLISLDEKIETLRQIGIDRVEVLTFDRQLMQVTAHDFMRNILRDRLDVRLLLTGYDNRFGKRNPSEDFDSYVSYGHELGIAVIEGPRPEECGLFEGQAVSSSLIRRLISENRTEEAKRLMQG